MAWTYKEWYQKNGAAHNKERRQRYHTDDAYRKKVSLWNEGSRNRRRAAESVLKRESALTSEQRIDHGPFRSFKIDGVVYFTIGALAAVLGCARQTVRKFERSTKNVGASLLPAPSLIKDGTRLYTYERICQLKEEWDASTLLEESHVSPLWKHVRFVSKTKPEEAPLFRLGAVVQLSGRAISSLIALEDQGILPRTPLLVPIRREDGSENGALRLYTVEQLTVLYKAFAAYPDLTDEGVAQRFTQKVIDGWKDAHILSKTGPSTATIIEE